jgi:hypothetical protein
MIIRIKNSAFARLSLTIEICLYYLKSLNYIIIKKGDTASRSDLFIITNNFLNLELE